ncbi:HAMP domain-containing sensor histidine kinase [Propionicimonas sp.]|uniref:sensor histidine kinase n=1 Tax=Propionicimonas sp. TaxID=1955623 RepID=UPI001859B753|nr:HAMP domain-containing sensor histidine kinase [Propionicimonas sp.]MBU3976871.1 HAMP domain-containing histidine kinase [Actinomycetota bacterium]MBA3019560.1 HAMP domain-containing histidine kinase [Propionicimonas sp.]MBU3986966.1 HAMP domain-containing histidine kinase [Actinomycetota bacterium]MBU4006878.1 HAMP domain-containing histidine kinase [Actinomycetota bacterium]MBU4065578.1 HAMP domain-containing histidine kinase [Actinomycetota bacterium]
MKKALRVVAVGFPVVLGVIAAVAVFLLLPGVQVRVTTAPAVLALGTGAALSALVGGWILARQLAERKRRELLDSGAAQARAEHQAFLARLDHEMKNPLTAIRAALAAHGTESSTHLQVADSQVARLGSLVGDLRKLSDLQSRPLEVEPVDLGQTVGEAVLAVQTYLLQLGSERHFAVHFPTAPWRIAPVPGDSDLLYLAVFNLLANAAKFTQDGDSVEVRAGEADGMVWLEVADTGLGIPEADLPQVWDELARATNARGIAGTGLGLPLVKVVVERHGGKVGLRSREGEGTSVRIQLPAARPPARAPQVVS